MLLSRMSETGNLGSHTAYADLQSHQLSVINEDGNNASKEGSQADAIQSGDVNLSSFEVKLKDAPLSTGHKKNLSEQFDDVLNITTGGIPSVQNQEEKNAAEDDVPPTTSPSLPSQHEEETIPSEMIDPKHRFANPDHLTFDPAPEYSAQAPATLMPQSINNMYYTTSSHGLHYPQYHIPSSGDQYHQYIYPPQTYEFPTTSEASLSTYLMPPPPPVLTPSSTDSRKHRREISEHHPMAHRRTNTHGESESTKWSYERDHEQVDIIAPIQENQPSASPVAAPPSFSNGYYQGFFPVPGQYEGFFAPPPFNVSSSQSDSGASYNMGSCAPILEAFGQSQSLRTSPNAELLYPTQQYGVVGYRGYSYPATKSGDDNERYGSKPHHRKESSVGSFLATTGIFEGEFVKCLSLLSSVP